MLCQRREEHNFAFVFSCEVMCNVWFKSMVWLGRNFINPYVHSLGWMGQKESGRVFDKFDICKYFHSLGYLKSEESHNLQKHGLGDSIFFAGGVFIVALEIKIFLFVVYHMHLSFLKK
jgi:hypothetical protein